MFTENEILLMIGVVSVLLLIITILTIFDIIDYIKDKKRKNKEKEEVIVTSKEIEEKEELPTYQENIEMLEIPDEVHVKDINNIHEELNVEPVIEDIVEPELVKVNDEPFMEEEVVPVIKVDDYDNIPVTNNVNLEKELNKALDTIADENDAISKFEEEQERTAIISLDELSKKSDDLYNSNELTQYDEGNEPITIDEVINRYGDVSEKDVPSVIEDIVKNKKEAYTHKETIPFISSVYGIEKNNSLEFENTATYEKLSKESTNEFMRKLREIEDSK